MKDVIRIGKVSSVNASAGTVRVTYPDRDDSVTAELPVFSFTDEYKMPSVGSQVLVVHLSNGTSAGICLGHYWNGSNQPPVSEGFRKELGEAYGDAYLEYADGKLTIHAPKIVLEGDVKTTADIDVSGVSAKNHTHTGVHGETSPAH